MKVRPYKTKLPSLCFATHSEYRKFNRASKHILDTYGSISYADILTLAGDHRIADDDENIFWYTIDNWTVRFDGSFESNKVWVDLAYPQYVVVEAEDRKTCNCPFCDTYTDGTEKIAVGRSCGPRRFDGNWNPESFLRYILRNNQQDGWWQYTFIIMGKSGPTGKTRLRDMLEDKGFKAFEVSEDLIGSGLVEYRSNGNHYFVNDRNKTVTIVLNKRLSLW